MTASGGDAWVKKTSEKRERGGELNSTGDGRMGTNISLGFELKRHRLKFFFFFNLIPKRRRCETHIKINNRFKRRRFAILQLKFPKPTTFPFTLSYFSPISSAVSPSSSFSSFTKRLFYLLKKKVNNLYLL